MRTPVAALFLAIGGALAHAGAAHAQTPAKTAPLGVAATIVAGCEIGGTLVTGTVNTGAFADLNFGSRSALQGGTVDTTAVSGANVSFACSPDAKLKITLDGGLHADGTRHVQLESGTARMAYALYQDAALTAPYTINQTLAPISPASGTMQIPIFGRLELAPPLPPGNYTDTVTLTVEW